jgi:hypothetical protein
MSKQDLNQTLDNSTSPINYTSRARMNMQIGALNMDLIKPVLYFIYHFKN